MRPPLLALAAVVVLVAAPAVGGWAREADQTVTATPGDDFVPPSVTIYAGEKVTWINEGGSHNVKFDDLPDAQPENPSSTWTQPVERTFSTPGTYRYVCEAHAPGMAGTVEVLAPPGGTTNPGPPPGGGGSPGGGQTDPGTQPGGGQQELEPLVVKLRASDTTPRAGTRFRLRGTVRPARDGRRLRIQKRLKNGSWRTVATVRLEDAGGAMSRFSVRLKLLADAVLRARVAGDDQRATGLSSRVRINVHGTRG
jgi:plastocyanin